MKFSLPRSIHVLCHKLLVVQAGHGKFQLIITAHSHYLKVINTVLHQGVHKHTQSTQSFSYSALLKVVSICYNICISCYSPELVADAVLLLVEDTSKAGAIARVTPHNGIDFHKFDRKPLFLLMQKLQLLIMHVYCMYEIIDNIRANIARILSMVKSKDSLICAA